MKNQCMIFDLLVVLHLSNMMNGLVGPIKKIRKPSDLWHYARSTVTPLFLLFLDFRFRIGQGLGALTLRIIGNKDLGHPLGIIGNKDLEHPLYSFPSITKCGVSFKARKSQGILIKDGTKTCPFLRQVY